MKQFIIGFTIIFSSVSIFAQKSNHVVISEFTTHGPASGSDEFVELYNPTEAEVNLQNWKLQYKAAGDWIDKAVLPVGAIIPAHGFYLVANENFGGPNSADYTSSLWTSVSGISVNGNLRIINDSLIEIDKAGYGNANDPEGSPAPNYGSAPSNQSIERKAFVASTADSLASGGLHFLSGNGYDSDNNANDFVRQTHGRNPQNSQSAPEPAFGVGGNGTGRITVVPKSVYNHFTLNLSFTIQGDSGYTLTKVRIIIPPTWTWSHSESDIFLSNTGFNGASLSVDGDTVEVTASQITNINTGIIMVNNIISPSHQTASVFRFITGVDGGTPAPIISQPIIKVNEIVPIVSIHVNDNQGVPSSPYSIGATVAVSGTVTANLSATQTNVFIQDVTGGVNLFSRTRPIEYHIGDSVVLSGSVLQFRGLTEITPDSSTVIILAANRQMPEPVILTCAEMNATFQPDYTEPNEGRLVRINSVSYNPNATPPSVTDATGTSEIFIPTSFPPTPSVFDVIGILKQFKPGTSPPPPYTQDYEIAPRIPEDIIAHPGPVITSAPVEDSIRSTSVRIGWTTDVASSGAVLYGTSTYHDTVNDFTPVTDHHVLLTGLTPATIYHYAVSSEDTNGRTEVGDFLFSSASPLTSTGRINVYFNKSVDTTVAAGEKALGSQDLTGRIIQRINGARYSIDACFYNLSSIPGATIADALINAKNRGVVVRVIGEEDNITNVPFSTLASNGIPVISDAFDVANGGIGLMHNKFAVIDYKGTAPESVWVWTGSWNPSGPGTNNDRQNSIELQDVALAGAYSVEFNEMWGSATSSPNVSSSRFGVRKMNNTPHRFSISGVWVESYFSPSDRTTSQIAKTLGKAQSSLFVSMYTFTRKDLADSLIVQKNRGKKVRAVFDNSTDAGSQFQYLQSNNVDAHLKGSSDGLLHHKYAIVDATPIGATAWTVTGSHNWSSSAENSNNENTLIIRDNRVANLFLQEFAARYTEAGGADPIVVEVKEVDGKIPEMFELRQNYPNPFNPETHLQFAIANVQFVSLKIYDVLGREVAALVNERMQPGEYNVNWNAGKCSTGLYFYELNAGSFREVRKMILLR